MNVKGGRWVAKGMMWVHKEEDRLKRGNGWLRRKMSCKGGRQVDKEEDGLQRGRWVAEEEDE
jgi:hypothetical protein